MAKHVRIFPYNPARGYKKQSYTFSGSGFPTFYEHKGWYVLPDDFAERMKGIRNNPSDPNSPPVFQVVDREEAEALDEVEAKKRYEAKAPIDLVKRTKKELDKAAPEKAKAYSAAKVTDKIQSLPDPPKPSESKPSEAKVEASVEDVPFEKTEDYADVMKDVTSSKEEFVQAMKKVGNPFADKFKVSDWETEVAVEAEPVVKKGRPKRKVVK